MIVGFGKNVRGKIPIVQEWKFNLIKKFFTDRVSDHITYEFYKYTYKCYLMTSRNVLLC